ncbi:hypothetical protein J3R82DRAFT_8656 [Butyriboletus roseoflavus]|nr:hypothetical protein J3R82DRAFT_8656 [Butyriboletus roseoflavus]
MGIPATIREYRSRGVSHHDFIIQNVPLSKPRASEVTIKIHTVSLQYRDLQRHLLRKKNVVPYSDGAGEIVAVGEDVKGWKIGDHVCPNFAIGHIHGDVTEDIKNTGLGGQIDGVLREYINVPAHVGSWYCSSLVTPFDVVWSLVRIPDYLTYEEGSTLPCAALTAYNAFHGSVPIKGGDYVLVLGTCFGAQIAPADGATVIATSSSDAKLEIVKKLGVQHLINYNTNPNWEDEVLKITEGRGVNHIIEVGGPNTIPKCIKAIRHAGQVHIIGCVRAITFRGILIGSVKQFEDMNRLFIARQIHPVVDKVFSFEEAIEAYSYLESQKHVGKVVIKVTKN